MLGLGAHKEASFCRHWQVRGLGCPWGSHGEGLKTNVFLVLSDLTVVGKKSYSPCGLGCHALPVLCGAWDSSGCTGIKLLFWICTCVLHSVTGLCPQATQILPGTPSITFPSFPRLFLPIHGTTGVTNTEIRWTMKERLHSSRLVACEMKKKTLFLSLVISHNTPTECINHYKTIELRMIFIYCWQLECGWKEIVLIIWGKSQNWELNRMRFENSETISTKKGLHFFLLSGGGRKDKHN